ncbi:hypothetical protein GCM10020255_012140 [Rhodococcus baikonurensis]
MHPAAGDPHNRCGGNSSSEGDDKATSAPGNTELKASGPITQPTKDGTTTFTSPFGPRWGTEHKGVDFAGPVGTPIYAALDGVAVKAGPASGFGNWIVLDSLVDGKPVSTVYGHMFDDGVLVTEGQQVKAGDHIANIGNNGQSTGAHLHFEYWDGGRLQGGTAVDPMTKLGGVPSPPVKRAVILLPSSWPPRHRRSTAPASAWQVVAISKPVPFLRKWSRGSAKRDRSAPRSSPRCWRQTRKPNPAWSVD